MRLTDRELEAHLRRSTQPDASRSACLSAETLTALSMGELDASERERAVEHLGDCAECAHESQLLESVGAWSESVTGPRVELFERPSRFPMALAASLAFVVAGLGAMNIWQWQHRVTSAPVVVTPAPPPPASDHTSRIDDLQRQLRELSQPQLNVPIIDIEAGGTRGAKSKIKTIELEPSATFFDLVLNLSDPKMYLNYGLEIRDVHDELLWQGSGLRRSAYDTFTLALPTRILPAGRYRLRLFSETDKGRITVEQYELEIVYR